MLFNSKSQSLDFSVESTSFASTTGETQLFNTLASHSQSASYGNLSYWDDYNPTRYGAYKDDYQFSASATGTVQVNLSSNQFDTYLQILDFNTGRLLAENDDSGSSSDSQVQFTTEYGKQYILRVTSYEAYETGAYTISTERISTRNSFSSTYGYGLVDAASAVAQSISRSRFSEVRDLGGTNWSNDLVKAPEAWAQGYTGQGVVVAVIDSGVDITHSDLRNNIWTNSDEIANDGIDNDRNGYIDDLYGWNFGVGQFNSNVMPGTSDSTQSHGTHVAGTIAASWNDFGITGVAPNAKIMALRMGDVVENRYTNGGSLAQAIRYAVDNGAQVINMSLGWTDTPELAEAFRYAASKNVITVTAAGNQSQSSPSSPAYYATQYGIAVGAVNRNLTLASFSNRAGSDNTMNYVVAPGVSIYSTVANGRYDYSQGTSMAAPHVAGVVALMLSANPYLTAAQVRQILTGTATNLSSNAASLSAEPIQFQTTVWQVNTSPMESDLEDLPVIQMSRNDAGMSATSLSIPMAESTTFVWVEQENIPEIQIQVMDLEGFEV
jgi:hypothetical protein